MAEHDGVGGVHWRGHALLFAKRPAPTYGASAGLRLLLIFFLLEGVIGPRLSLFSWLHLPLPPLWLRVPLLLGLALLLVRFVAGVRLAQIGLHPWREWSRIERSYCLQVIVIANVVFCVIFAARLRAMLAGPALPGRILMVFLPCFLWASTRRSSTAASCRRSSSAAGGLSGGSWSAIPSSPSAPCTSTTSRTGQGPSRCSRGSSPSACSSR